MTHVSIKKIHGNTGRDPCFHKKYMETGVVILVSIRNTWKQGS